MAPGRRPVRLGLIGCGRVAEERHLVALRNVSAAKVVAVADSNSDRLRVVADRFHIQDRYPDYRAMLDAAGLDAVAVCVPPRFHAEIALAALDAEKHVFIEKPLALTMDEANAVVARAARSPVKVLVGFNLRWHRLVREARAIIQRGTLGRVELVRTTFAARGRFHQNVPQWRLRREQGAGVMFDLAVHHFDLWRFLLSADVEEVFAMTWAEESAAERTAVTARMTHGLLALSLFSQGVNDSNEVEIYGDAGCLRFSCYRFDSLELLPAWADSGALRTRLRGVARVLKELPRAALQLRRGGDHAASYEAQWRHFIDAIQRDTPVGCPADDGRQALQVALAAVQSASSGLPIRVAPGSDLVRPHAGSSGLP